MKIGTKVTNRKGWTGIIVERPKSWGKKLFNEIPSVNIVYVKWHEREQMILDKNRDNHNIKDAVVSALVEYLIILD